MYLLAHCLPGGWQRLRAEAQLAMRAVRWCQARQAKGAISASATWTTPAVAAGCTICMHREWLLTDTAATNSNTAHLLFDGTKPSSERSARGQRL
jgi:hypothetical protein